MWEADQGTMASPSVQGQVDALVTRGKCKAARIPGLCGRKVMTNLNRILKAETLLCQQSPSSQSMVFPVVVYGCESWTIKKAEHRRIYALNCGVGEDS